MNYTRQLLRNTITAWSVLLVCAGLLKAGETGKIAGRVIDAETQAALGGANVIVSAVWIDDEEVELESSPGAATDMQGEYFVLNLRPGQYTVRVFYIGYITEVRTHVTVVVDKTTRLDFELSPQVLAGEEVTITAYRPDRVEEDLTATKQVYTVSEVQSIAGVADISDILNLQADVVDDHFRGGRLGESQYLLGGSSIVNPLNNQRAFLPIVTGLEQVEVYTSGFSAEYGNAQSGVVNMVAREGRNTWESRAEVAVVLPYYKTWGESVYDPENLYFYDLLRNTEEWLKENPTQPGRPMYDAGYGFSLYTPAPDLSQWPPYFPTYEDTLRIAELGQILWLQSVRDLGLEYNNTFDHRLDFSVGGPIADNLKFFFAGRQNITHPKIPTPTPDIERQVMSSLIYQPNLNNKIKLSMIHDLQLENNLGSQWLRWMFDRTLSIAHYRALSQQYGFEWEHILSHATFVDIRLRVLDLLTQDRVELLNEGEFVVDYSSNLNWVDYTGPSNHRVSRPQDDRGNQQTTTYSFQTYITSQINHNNLLKAGLQFFYYYVDVDEEMNISNEGSYRDVSFNVNPYEGALFLQDKMEFKGLIANLGLRLDFYNLNVEYFADQFSPLRNPDYDPTKPYLERGLYYDPELSLKEKTKLYIRLQPRIGISFPVSETAVFHLNYGTFTQRPNFNQIFYNQMTLFNEIEVLGNPRLRPENTKAYDVGWVKGLPLGMRLDVSAYYKDVKDLVETAYYYDEQQAVYRTYMNRDYADIKGFHVSLEKISGTARGFVRYNYEAATGKSSNDLDAPVTYFENPAPGQEAIDLPDPEDIYLDYDRTHKAVFNIRYQTSAQARPEIFAFHPFANIRFSTTLRINTGRPYTWDDEGKGLKMNERSPTERELRIRVEKEFRNTRHQVTLYAEMFNVLNEEFFHYSRTFNHDWNTPKWEKDRENVLIYNEYYPYVSDQSVYLLRNEPRHVRLGLIVKF
ncbi:MAG: TonB-dependent receptor [Fidelibacterota bacterium]|nr:MAG: TonB-dependent receptor [Candidatus Neomarinimicrobiota bacterium]